MCLLPLVFPGDWSCRFLWYSQETGHDGICVCRRLLWYSPGRGRECLDVITLMRSLVGGIYANTGMPFFTPGTRCILRRRTCEARSGVELDHCLDLDEEIGTADGGLPRVCMHAE